MTIWHKNSREMGVTLIAASDVETSFGWFFFIVSNISLSPRAIKCSHEASMCFHLTLMKFWVTLHKSASEGGPSFILFYYNIIFYGIMNTCTTIQLQLWSRLDFVRQENIINENYNNHNKMRFRHQIILLQYNDWRIIGGEIQE